MIGSVERFKQCLMNYASNTTHSNIQNDKEIDHLLHTIMPFKQKLQCTRSGRVYSILIVHDRAIHQSRA